jgi:hypothetical protein
VVSNSLRLLKLPEGVQKALGEGQISERVAVALIGMYDLPENVKSKIIGGYNGISPEEITRGALNGNLTSDQIREKIQWMCNQAGYSLDKVEWGLDDIASSLIDIDVLKSVTCRDCEFRYKDRNICLGQICFTAKQNSVRLAYLQSAGRACGILPAEELSSELDAYHRWQGAEFSGWKMQKYGFVEKIVGSHCENLRLIYDKPYSDSQNKNPDRVPGFPNAQIVCKKLSGYCRCLNALEATQIVHSGYDPEDKDWKTTVEPTEIQLTNEQPTAAELSDLAAEAKRHKNEARQYARVITTIVGELIGDALRSNNSAAWKKLAAEVHYKCGQEERNAAAVQDSIGVEFAVKALPYEYKTELEIEKAMGKLLESLGIPIDLDLFPSLKGKQVAKMAQLEAESAAIAARCQAEGKTLVEMFEAEEQAVEI